MLFSMRFLFFLNLLIFENQTIDKKGADTNFFILVVGSPIKYLKSIATNVGTLKLH